jgi:hypothetical protein
VAQIQPLAATTEVELGRSPFLPGNPVQLTSVPGGTLYGVDLAAEHDPNKYQAWRADGSSVQWTEDDLTNLADADVSAPAASAQLANVVKVNGSVIHRTLDISVPATGEFSVTNGARGVATLVFSGVPVDAATITLIDNDSGGANTVEFEFDTDDDDLDGAGTEVDTSGDTTAAEAAASFVTAVNTVGAGLEITARDMGDGTVVLFQDNIGAAGNTAVAVAGDTGDAITAPAAFTEGEDAGTVAIQFGDIYSAGTEIELFLQDTDDIDATVVAANIPLEWEAKQVVYPSAAMQITRLTR